MRVAHQERRRDHRHRALINTLCFTLSGKSKRVQTGKERTNQEMNLKWRSSKKIFWMKYFLPAAGDQICLKHPMFCSLKIFHYALGLRKPLKLRTLGCNIFRYDFFPAILCVVQKHTAG